MKKLFCLVLLSVASLVAQGGPVNQTDSVPPDNFVFQYFYSGTNLIYECRAYALQQKPTTYSVAATTLTNVVVSANVGTVNLASTAQFWVGATLTLAGSATSALNGTYPITAVSGSTVTITTAGVSNGTYNDSTLVLTTNSPLLNAAIWAIQAFKYDGSNNLIGKFWAGTPSIGPPQNLACSNRANY